MVFRYHSNFPHVAGVCAVYSEVPYVRDLRRNVQEHTQHFLQILHRVSHLYHCFWHGILLPFTESGKSFLARLQWSVKKRFKTMFSS